MQTPNHPRSEKGPNTGELGSRQPPDRTSAREMSRIDLDRDPDWDQERWVNILDRIEHRDPDVGLRFWGPPLWLEVTMVGPDSDRWPTISEQATTWDWQSDAPCVEATALADEGADDDRLLNVVSRYTIENLILNAVHEIGEWFRFDGQRVFPAHRPRAAAPSDRDDQGNGSVTLQVAFGGTPQRSDWSPSVSAPNQQRAGRLVGRLTEAAAASRFTYLPGTAISYDVAGPVIRRWSEPEPTASSRFAWSSSTLRAEGADGADLVALVSRDVHGALVSHEVDRICRAFHVDGSRRWNSAVSDSALGADHPRIEAHDMELLSTSINYLVASNAPDRRSSF
jgi:hypothetical protein